MLARLTGISANVTFSVEESTLQIKLEQEKAHEGGAATQLRLFVSHPAEKSRDKTFVLKQYFPSILPIAPPFFF